MSTENEGAAVPPAPSAPPVPVESPEPAGSPAAPSAAEAPAAGQDPAATAVQHPVQDPPPAAPDAGTARMPAYPPPAPPQPGGPVAQGPGQAPDRPPVQPGHPGQAPGQPGYAPGQPGATGSPASGEWPAPPPATPMYADAGAGGGAGWGSSYQSPEQRPGGRRGGGGLVAAVLVAALVAGGIGGGIGYWAAERSDNATDSTTVSASNGPSDIKRSPNSVAGIAARALPSVVTIEAQSGNGDGGTGTGFVYDKQGHILTNNHVVAAAAGGGTLSATFSDGKKYRAEVVGRAQGYDVAVIKLKNAPSNLKPLPLGDSGRVAVGDSTIAIGAPFGLSNTVTTGIISAKDRPVTTSESGNSNDASYMSALQTDASINPGNSGGPLLDARGAVIGINSAIKPSSDGGMGGGGQGGSIGLGFAIPINQAKNVAKQLIKTGQPVYPVIGASVALDDQAQGNGAVLSDQGPGGSQPITPGGPADKAGLKPGDVITRFDDSVIDSGPTLIGEIWNHQPGDTVKITYKRDGKEHTVNVTLGERKGDSTS
ncbi:protease [Streptomyces sulfonofaciens]|uniref:Protease n=1 Tax=Streptomyces sulfonofaciens TaxID=68272 RepID=A0A919FQ94_9ACTN|nr:trypsin-like peptidase domain-containing protein [Streptomyces sulfonofaciens]GHH69919.1 protease [Streptomyces sulfonofaciens]